MKKQFLFLFFIINIIYASNQKIQNIKSKEKNLKQNIQNNIQEKKLYGYFSTVYNPGSVDQLNNIISDSIKNGGKYFLFLNWRQDCDANNIQKVIQATNSSNDILEKYKIVIISIQSQIPDLQEALKVIGFGDYWGNNSPPTIQKGMSKGQKQNIQNQLNAAASSPANNFHIGLIFGILPNQSIESGTSYFVENSTLPFNKIQLIMDKNAINSSIGDNSIGQKIKDSIQNYLNSNNISVPKITEQNLEKKIITKKNEKKEPKTLKKLEKKKNLNNLFDFSNIITPTSLNELNEQIDNAILANGQACLFLSYRGDSDSGYLSQITSALNSCSSILKSYRIISIILQSDIPDFQTAVKFLGFGDSGGGINLHPSLISFLLPKKPLKNNQSYFDGNNLFTKIQMIMDRNAITNHLNELSSEVQQSIQSYISSNGISPIEVSKLNIKDEIEQAGNFTKFTPTAYNQDNFDTFQEKKKSTFSKVMGDVGMVTMGAVML